MPPSIRLGAPVPRVLEKLILACLEKAPEDRPQSAAEVQRALSQLAASWTEEQLAA